jgi:hypothetical protein
MKFKSPWQSPVFIRMVATVRLFLRTWGSMEDRFITHITRRQNDRVLAYLQANPAKNILLIMPRCVKKTGCKAEVQQSLSSCLTCQECPLGHVARLCSLYGVQALVAFRSHQAFEIARRHEPDLIIATACGDRLVKALRSVPHIPALLAPLTGMEKQCLNAGIDLQWLNTQLAIATATPLQPLSFTAPLTDVTIPELKEFRSAEGS